MNRALDLQKEPNTGPQPGLLDQGASPAIAYLVPEFPGQTHAFFWREQLALREIGVTAHLVSTKRPPREIVSNDWSNQAEQETVYLADLGLRDIVTIGLRFMAFGPRAWRRAFQAAAEDCPLQHWPTNLALMFLSVQLVSFMRARGVTHVHVHSCGNSALLAMFANQLAGLSYSLTLHGDLHDYGRQQRTKWRHAAFAITITRRLFDQVRRILNTDIPPLLGLAPMGVNPDFFKRASAYKPWQGDGPLRLFSCGRLNFVKGHHELIRAVAILRKNGFPVCLEIAGEDEAGGRGFRKELEKLITELDLAGGVVLLGAVGEKAVLRGLESAHIFVLASHHEPLGVAIMEALSCEVPVIATNLGGVTELVDDGVDGYLVPPKDPNLLAEAIQRIARDPALAQTLSTAGRSKIKERFSSKVSAAEIKRLLQTRP